MSHDSRPPIPDSQSDEPTVLDLFKSTFKDWDSFFNFLVSVFDAARREQINRSLAEKQEVIVEPAPELETFNLQPATRFPWRALLGLGFALFAQRALEPPGRMLGYGIALYFIALALVLWSYFADTWELPPLPPEHDRRDPETLRLLPLIVATVLAFAAFASFGGNTFKVGNVTLWLLAIAFFVYSLWLPYRRVHRERNADERRLDMLWSLLILGVAALAIFFRVYQIGSIPPEPFSDHAEKILDVHDITQGQTHIFFPRNTGREALQMYWTLLMSWIFGSGLSFLSLKIGTVLLGLLTLPYMYLLGVEIGGKRVGLFALFFAGIGYWPNVISRVGLRFPLYPLFVAPTLYYLIRGLRTRNRNDFILSGLFLGLGLHGYSPIRIVPIMVLVAIGLYLLHAQSRGVRRDAILWLVILGLASLVVFTPLLRYSIDNPEVFSYRAFTRLGSAEQPLPAPALQIFFSNLWKGLGMFNWDDGEIWVHSVTHRPALDLVSGALFLIGVILLLVRYLRKRHWLDLFLLLSILLLALPSILSLAFPAENPALNRAGGAYVPVFVIVALALDSLVTAIGRGKLRAGFAWGLAVILMAWSGVQNYDLVFRQYYEAYRGGAWNSSEMGAVIKQFKETYGETDTVWIVPFPHWVDTRLPGVWAGIPNRDFAVWRENLPETVQLSGPKLFMVKANPQVPEADDQETLDLLKELYPAGSLELYRSDVEGHDFWMYSVPGQ
ncbi:MAG: glycosyltransferase family 39 protein [Anaerolineales bacterium]|nr:glycosyltransferase family 39 protein [Anaerolineales bacterium]